MSLSGFSSRGFPNSLTGLQNINVSDITIDGKSIKQTYVPYTGATKPVDLGAQKVTSTYYATLPPDLVNFQVLKDAIDGQDIFNAGQFLDKVGVTGQSVVSGVTFLGALSLPSLNPSQVLVTNASRQLVASGIGVTKLGYLDNVTSDIQTQLNGKLNLTGGTLSGPLDLGSNKITTTYTPVNPADLTNKSYVDAAVSGGGSAYVRKIGDTMTGNLTMGSNFVKCSADPVANEDLARKTYVDTLIVGRIPRSGDTSLIGDFATTGTISASTLNGISTVTGNYIFGSQVVNSYSSSDGGEIWMCAYGDTASTSNVFSGEFHITYAAAGQHAHMSFRVSNMYNSNPTITILNSTFYGTPLVNTLSLHYSSTDIYARTYIGFGLSTTGWYSSSMNIRVIKVNQANGNSNLVLQSTKLKSANLPSGYTSTTTLSTNAGLASYFAGQKLFFNGNLGVGTDNPTYKLEVNGSHFCRGSDILGRVYAYGNGGGDGGTQVIVRNLSAGDAYAFMGVQNNSNDGCYWFINSSTRSADGGANTCTLRNDIGDLRLQARGAGIVLKANTGWVGVGEANPGALLDIYSTGGSYNTSLRVRSAWAGLQLASSGSGGRTWNFTSTISGAGAGAGHLAIFDETAGQYRMYWHQNGSVAINSAADGQAVKAGSMAAGSLTIGNGSQNYGWGTNTWNSNTAGLLLECADLTEIAVHDWGHRVASLMAYAGGSGRSNIYLGRDMGWGVSFTCTSGDFGVNTDQHSLTSPESSSSAYGNVATVGNGRSNWNGYALQDRYVFMKSNSIAEGGIHDNVYSWLFRWDGSSGRVCWAGGGSCLFCQNYDRFQVFRNGYDYTGGYFYVNQGGGYGMSSDARIKENIEQLSENKSIAFLKGINPAKFNLKHQQPCKRKLADGTEEEFVPTLCNCPEEGFIAQNVLASAEASGVCKAVVAHWSDYEEEMKKPVDQQQITNENTLGVNDRPILAHCVNVIKSLLSRVEALESRLAQSGQTS
jgi:hypothetical protein